MEKTHDAALQSLLLVLHQPQLTCAAAEQNSSMQQGKDIRKAAQIIRSGGIAGYPTEGVFGIGCDPQNIDALKRLIDLKQRDTNKGLIIIAANRNQLEPFIAEVKESIERKLYASWPGPVTWILESSENASPLLTGNRNTVATRVTSHATAAELCMSAGHAIVSTSANLSGQPSCRDAQSVANCFGDRIDYLLDLPVGDLDKPTPIFDGATGKQLR